MSKEYRIDLSYNADKYFDDPDADRTYSKIVGRESDGSGMGMSERDMSWTLSSKARAMTVFDKLSALRDKNLLRVTLTMQDGGE